MIDFIAYGICPASPADFKVASECSVLNGIMYFVNAQNHTLMGIGAEITYDTTKVVYVVGKISENIWVVRTGGGYVPGDSPGNVTCNGITHPFASQSTFEAGIAGIVGGADLTIAEVSVQGVCYCEQAGFTVDNTAVTYDGTTCSAAYGLKIYTIWDTVRQGNFQHRVTAGGVWDVQKYRLELAAQIVAVGNSVNQYIDFSGIQFHMSSVAAAAISSIHVQATSTSEVNIDSCVIRVADVNANWLRSALRVDAGPVVLSNSIVYLIGLQAMQGDFNGIIAAGADATLSVTQCTIYGWQAPITESAGAAVIAYNNAIIGNTVICVGVSTQDYNVYDINEGEAHGFLTVQADAALFAAVAGGRETWNWNPLVGSNLINRAQHFNLYTNDLDNEAGWRYQSIAPDAGALERTQVVCPFGVCPNGPADFQTGNGLVTVLNGIGSFDVPQSNVLMGVGAEIDYGGGPAIAYVKEMINPFQFILVTGAGAAAPNAADQAINSISHPFASQSAAEAGFAALTGNLSLVIGDYQLYLPCYAEQATYTADAVAVDYDGPLCDFGHWIKLFQTFSTVKESNMQHRVTNGGVWDATRYRIEVANNPVIDISNTVILMLMTGMQIHLTLNNASNAVLVRGGANSITLICGCVTVSNGTNQVRRGIASEAPAGKEIIIINNVITMTGAGVTQNNQHGISCSNSKIDIWAYQNTIDLFRDSINVGVNVTCIAKNNAFVDNGLANTGVDTSDYNLYREFDEGDANGILTLQNNNALFEAYDFGTAEDSDWSPAAGSDLIGKGITGPGELVNFAFYLEGDLDHPFETEWRPQIGGYAIGALEKFAGSGYIPQWYTYW
ncbi:MAG: hypothetical protein GY845_09420 [Planctomycetes bacterium]|nr:hypothetical protein [Planctomycetota bacterium]